MTDLSRYAKNALVARSPALGFVPKQTSRPARSKRCSHQSSIARRTQLSATLTGVDVEPPEQKPDQKERIRVVLADDSVLLREGIASLLEGKGFEIVGQSK